MSILRKLLSVLVINAAVFMITLSFTAWVFDTKLLDAPALTTAFDKNGVSKAIASAIPEMVVPDEEKQHGPDGQEIPPDPAEKAQVQETIRKSVDEPYVKSKINGLITTTISFVKTGSPQPSIDLTDFTKRVESATGETIGNCDNTAAAAAGTEAAEGCDKIGEILSKPVNLTENPESKKVFDTVRKSYDYLALFKIIGPIIALVLLVAEWFLTPSGKRLGKTAWVFIAAGFWGLLWWFLATKAPDFIITKVKADKSAEQSLVAVAEALINSVSSLLANSFLQFGIACLGVAGAILLVRFLVRRFGPPKGVIGKPVPAASATAKTSGKR